MTSSLTHLNQQGSAHMVDVGSKPETARRAVASGRLRMQPETLRLAAEGQAKKGDVLGVARVAAIIAAKKTGELIPLCHPLPLTHVSVEMTLDPAENVIICTATAETFGRTGVEMEALSAVSIGLLTLYDMLKASDKGMVIEAIRLVEKTGGKSDWKA